MYIDKIDNVLDVIIDDLYSKMSSIIIKLSQESNFVKQQQYINDLFFDYFENSSCKKDIANITNNEDNINSVIQMLKRYACFYFFIYLGLLQTKDIKDPKKSLNQDNVFGINIVEFSKRQSTLSFQVNNFFNSSNIGLVVKYIHLCKNVLIYINADRATLEILNKKSSFIESIDFLNALGRDFVELAFIKLKDTQIHNLVKTVIVYEIYRNTDKKNMSQLMENISEKKGEYIYIDIVVSKYEQVDMELIESVISEQDKQLNANLVHDLWNMINGTDTMNVYKNLSMNDKINKLFSSGRIVPIVNDFLMYHKELEKYDRFGEDNAKREKEYTRIKYIVDKIESATKGEIEVFDNTMNERKTVSYNDIEDVKIINKYANFTNVSKSASTSENFITELIYYRRYPYINFKDISNNSFYFNFENTRDAVRQVTIGNNKLKQLQMRTTGEVCTVSGLMIQSLHKPLMCTKISELENVREKNNSNGYKLFCKNVINSKKHNIYWLFDLSKDKFVLDEYEKSQDREYVKLMMLSLYDYLNKYQLTMIKKKLKKRMCKPNKLLQYLYMLSKTQLFFSVEDTIDNINILREYVCTQMITKTDCSKMVDFYDDKDDIFYGLHDKAKKLPKYDPKEYKKIPVFKITSWTINDVPTKKLINSGTYNVNILNVGICQHNVSWEKLQSTKKTNITKYSVDLYNFMEQYVEENYESKYICKSCGGEIEMVRYVQEGEFDQETKKYITYGEVIDYPLEDMHEYSKLKGSIRTMSKMLNKIGDITGISYISGNSKAIRSARKSIIKNTIDVINIVWTSKIIDKFKNSKSLESVNSKYGIKKSNTQMFGFDLEDAIFIFTSKGKDIYKKLKTNNVVAYLIIFILLDINETHINLFKGNKREKKEMCSYTVYTKYGRSLFDNISIFKNRDLDTDNIYNYQVLCYLLFYISYYVAKHNVWDFSEEKVNMKTKHVDPRHQIIIIHTVLDILITLLSSQNTDKLFSIITTRFFKQMNTIFKNVVVLDQFDCSKNTKKTTENKEYITGKIEPININTYTPFVYHVPYYLKYTQSKHFIPQLVDNITHITKPNKITNCDDGKFHTWVYENKMLVCKLCKVKMNDIKDKNTSFDDDINKNIVDNSIKEISKYICPNNNKTMKHVYVFDGSNKTRKCVHCDKVIYDTLYSKKDIEKIISNYFSSKKLIDTKRRFACIIPNTQLENEDVVQRFVKNKIDVMKNTQINITDKKILYMMNDIYTIDHNYKGVLLKTPETINSNNKKFYTKHDTNIYKRDVLIYNNTNNFSEHVYDYYTNKLIGYKENGKDYAKIATNSVINVNYSLASQISLIGCASKYFNLKNKQYIYHKESIYTHTFISNEQEILDIVNDMQRDRINNLTKCIPEILRITQKINNYSLKATSVEDYGPFYFDVNKKMDMLIDKYHKMVPKLNTNNVFVDWNNKMCNVKHETIYSYDKIKKYVHGDIFDNYMYGIEDMKIKYITKYILDELDKLINDNNNQHIIRFVCELICYIFEMYNEESYYNDIEIKKFEHRLHNYDYVNNSDFSRIYLQGDIYEEYADNDVVDKIARDMDKEDANGMTQKSKIEDEIEESNALDIDNFDEDVIEDEREIYIPESEYS